MLAVLTLLAAAAAPDIYFITVDTLRADRLGCYGHEYDTSPNLDRLAAESLLYEDFICEVPLTGPSFGSMLSSHYPRTTGVTKNGLRMPDWAPLVTEQFKELGYESVCVQSNWTLKGKLSGLDRGFDTYDDEMDSRRWGILNPERTADEVLKRSLALMEKRDPAKPLFAWFHFSDPHAPYKMHDYFNPWNKRTNQLDETDSARARYDSEVAFTDHHIQQLLEAIPTDRPHYVVFLGDHGESLYEHDYLGHGRRIHQTGMHVPFMIKGPGIEPGRTEAPGRGVDIGVTLLALIGLDPAETMVGRNLLKPDEVPMDRVRIVETYGGAVPQIAGVKALLADKPPMRQGAYAEEWKLIHLSPRTQLFNLAEDPEELTNLADEMPDRVAELTAMIEAWSEAYAQVEGEEVELNEDDLEALESLGYLD